MEASFSGSADAAAMFAINEPNVVLGSAETRFLAPVVVGETLLATATVTRIEGKKHFVEVDVICSARSVRGQGLSGHLRVLLCPPNTVLAQRGEP